MFPRSVVVVALALSAAITWLALSPSCRNAPPETEADRARRDGVLLLGNGAEPLDLDPQVVTGIPEFHILEALTEGLVEPDPQGHGVAPGVAQSWTASADGRTWTFALHPQARWSNGDALTAEDFVRSYERILHPEFAAEYSYLYACVVGADDYHAGRTRDFATVGFRAVDARTLEIRLVRPVPYFLELLTYPCWRPVHLPTVTKHGGLRRRGTAWTRPENFVGNGAFRLARWEINKVIAAPRNPHYWDAGKVLLNEVRFLPVDNAETEERMFRSGQLHKTNDLPPAKVDAYRRTRPEALRIDPLLGVYFFRFNTTKPPFDDARVRRAFAEAIDRPALVNRVLRGDQRPAHAFTPPGAGGFFARVEGAPAAARARRLLAEAGFPDGAGFPEVELLYNTSENHRLIAEAVQEMWRANLGVRVTLRNEEWKVFLESQRRMKYTICRAGWTAIFNDPGQFLEIFTGASGNNHTGWTSAAYDAQFAEAQATLDRERRFHCFQEMENLLAHEQPVAPVYYYTRTFLLDPAVRGWAPTPLDKHPLKHVWFAPD